MSSEPLEQAIAVARDVVGRIDREALGSSTPCASWTVTDVLNHMVGTQRLFVALAAGETPTRAPVEVTADDYMAQLEDATDASLAAMRAAEGEGRTFTLPFGELSHDRFAKVAATDVLTHSWDIAKATGQSTDLAPQLAETLLANVRSLATENFRGPDGQAFWADEQPVPADAPAADRLAAFLGRTV